MFYESTPWVKYTLGSIFLGLVIHLIFGFILGASVDEAHYALYGLYLDWSYFDHPPLVGWLQALPVHLNWSIGFLRLIPQVIWFASVLLCLRIAQILLQRNRADYPYLNANAVLFWTALCVLLAPVLHVLSVGLLPDTLLLFLVPSMILITLQLDEKLQDRKPQDLLLWLLLGLVLGLAGLSKYTSLFFALAIPVCLISWHGLQIFSRPGLYLCVFLAAVLISPVLYWNYHNDWLSFTYQFAHGASGEWRFKKMMAFVLNQFAAYGLLISLGVVWHLRKSSARPLALLSFFYIPLLLFTFFAGSGKSLPHWTAPAWFALTPVAGIGLAHAWNFGRRFWVSCVGVTQTLICLAGFTVLFLGGLPWVDKDHTLGKKNPIADLYGWSAMGQRAVELSTQHATAQLAVQNWTLGSRLAWYAKPLPVYILDTRFDQFDLWSGALALHSNALVVNWSQMSFVEPVSAGAFKTCDLVDTLTVPRFGREIAQFDFWLCKDWQGQPTPQRSL